MRLVIQTLAATYPQTREQRKWPTWIASGPRFFSEVVRGLPLRRYPRVWFYPESWHNLPLDVDTARFRDSYMIQYGYTTNRLDQRLG